MSFKFHSIESNHYDPGFTGGEWKYCPEEFLTTYDLTRGNKHRLVFDNGSTVLNVYLIDNTYFGNIDESKYAEYYLDLIKGFNGDPDQIENFVKL